jgi:hypothetical protein
MKNKHNSKECEYAIHYSRELNECKKGGFCNHRLVVPPIGSKKLYLCSKLKEVEQAVCYTPESLEGFLKDKLDQNISIVPSGPNFLVYYNKSENKA